MECSEESGVKDRVILACCFSGRNCQAKAKAKSTGPGEEICVLHHQDWTWGWWGDACGQRGFNGHWQERWDSEPRAAWTRRVIRELSVWVERGFGEVTVLPRCSTPDMGFPGLPPQDKKSRQKPGLSIWRFHSRQLPTQVFFYCER